MKRKITLLNIISSIILQIANILSAFIIPKIILTYFGSNINGLVSSLSQFLNYITLVEGGITGVITASLYKPLIEKDKDKISSIVVTANSFFKKIGIVYIIYSILLAIIYPIVINKSFDFFYVFSLTLIMSINLLIQYMFSLTYRTLLNADKKVYIVSLTQTAIIISNIVLSFISVKIMPSIHILKLINGLLFIIQPLVFNSLVKRYYTINTNAEKDDKLIKNRWDGFAINVAAFIHFSTDVTILTLFTNLSTVSIYSVYTLVTNGLRSIINSISSAITPTVGHAYAKGNLNELNTKFDLNEFIIFILVFYLFTIAGLLITPFVMIYTKNVHDANYNQFIFGILLVLSEAIYLIKFPHLNLAYSANKFKDITMPAFIEAIINISVSIILVKKLGINGVAIGTIISMIYRMIFHINYTKKLIKNRSRIIFYKKFIIFTLTTLIGLIVCYYTIPLAQFNIASWLIHAIIYMVLFGLLYFVMCILFFKKELKFLKEYLMH